MKIESMEIKNFRTLENVKIDFDGYFSSISGRNNAGKTSVIKCIRALFKGQDREYFLWGEDDSLSYTASKTQWAEADAVIELNYVLSVSRLADPGLFSFVKKIAEMDSLAEEFKLEVNIKVRHKEEMGISIFINGEKLEKYEAGEIYQRLSSSNVVFMHNSTGGHSRLMSLYGARSFHEMILSKDEREELKREQDRIKKKVKRFAQEHRGELSGLLGKLEDKYEVEFTVFDGLLRDSIPLGINLKDRGLEVSLDDWGAGTQNRTHIMMSILSASRVKQQVNDENRITPIIIIEEPESFLHPSAQAEFGRVIRGLARELEIQIIITTHSPYMLCQEMPESNILLNRRLFRNRLKETVVVGVTSDKWMEPFSEILGLNHEAVEPWVDVVKAAKDDAILVEGPIDKEYLEYISSLNIRGYELPAGVAILPYGGKDALKNSIMLKFVIEKFDRVLVTYDLDAQGELRKVMDQLGLKEGEDYIPVGLPESGKECIEGLLPKSVLSDVYAKNTDHIMKLTSNNASERKSAKSNLKRLLLEELKSKRDVSASDVSGFKSIFQAARQKFSRT